MHGVRNVRALSIPEERVGVLIGSNGDTLDKIRSLVNASIDVNGNEITVDAEDPLEELRAFNIVKAIGRGFTPEKALRLLERNASLAVINIGRYCSTNNDKERLKGRIIGKEGMTREKIENDTDTEIAVYGKTVSVLGPIGKLEVAKKTIEMLLEGSSHGAAYRYLEDNIRKIVKA